MLENVENVEKNQKKGIECLVSLAYWNFMKEPTVLYTQKRFT